MERIFSDIGKNIINLTKSAKEEFFISSPWIKKNALDHLIKGFQQREIHLNVLTTRDVVAFCRGISDIEAFEKLFDVGAKIRIREKLHAKIFISDSNKAIISSANLTNAGFSLSDNVTKNNAEIGIFLEDEKEVLKVREIFEEYFQEAKELNKSDFEKFKQNVESKKKEFDKIKEFERNIRNEVNIFNVPKNQNNKIAPLEERMNEYLKIYREAYRSSGNHLEMGRLILSQTRRLLDFLDKNIQLLTPKMIFDFAENLRRNTHGTIFTNDARMRKFPSGEAFSFLLFSSGDKNYNLTKGKYHSICIGLDRILSQSYYYNSQDRLWQPRG